MCSIHRILAIASLAVAAVGCQRAYVPTTAKLNPAPILVDDAMAQRHWSTSVVMYANGSSTGFPTLYPYVPRTNTPEFEQAWTGPGLMIAQTVALPVTVFITPPWELTLYRGIYTPPTYTAVPVMPNDAEKLAAVTAFPIEPRKP